LLSLALLFGQLGAEAHAYSHLSDKPDGLPGSTQSCRACLSFAPLTNAVGGSPCAFTIQPQAVESFVAIDAIRIPDSPLHRAYRSRAPPTLL
jgi:hypothetical protein